MNIIQLEALRILGSAANHIIRTSKDIEICDDGEVLMPERTRLTLWYFTYFAGRVIRDGEE